MSAVKHIISKICRGVYWKFRLEYKNPRSPLKDLHKKVSLPPLYLYYNSKYILPLDMRCVTLWKLLFLYNGPFKLFSLRKLTYCCKPHVRICFSTISVAVNDVFYLETCIVCIVFSSSATVCIYLKVVFPDACVIYT